MGEGVGFYLWGLGFAKFDRKKGGRSYSLAPFFLLSKFSPMAVPYAYASLSLSIRGGTPAASSSNPTGAAAAVNCVTGHTAPSLQIAALGRDAEKNTCKVHAISPISLCDRQENGALF